MIRTLALACLGLGLASCSQAYESRIRSSLVQAGLSRPVSNCMAERMVDRLSKRQLDSLARLGEGGRIGDLTIDQFIRRYRRTIDPEVYLVLTRAGIGCAITA